MAGNGRGLDAVRRDVPGELPAVASSLRRGLRSPASRIGVASAKSNLGRREQPLSAPTQVQRREPHWLCTLDARAAHHPQLPGAALQLQLVHRPALQRRAPAQPEPQQAAVRRQLHRALLPS